MQRPLYMAAALAAVAPAWAQTAAAPPSSTVVITGNPLGSSDVAAPTSVLTGDRLVQRRGASLGDTLDGLTGVATTGFGPHASRPIIRGQDGDRIRVLTNSGASIDASSLSVDHAVPIDPLAIERVEVLRGPAALLYGGSAVGGVVNTIDNRIPRAPLAGFGGAAELRLGGAGAERSGAAVLETGGNGFAVHADAFGRRTRDLRVPAFDRPLPDGTTERRKRVVNSAGESEGGALGASWVGARGYLGASVDTFRSDYGSVAEEEVTLRMKRDRVALAGELRDIGGFFGTLRGQVAHTDYEHREFEGAELGTTFANRGEDLRLEAVHRALPLGGGQLEGVAGVQAERSRFSALGHEAFVPSTRSRQSALFLLEQWKAASGLQLSAGARAERARVDSSGDAPDAEEPRFGAPQSRRFSLASGSLGALWPLASGWQLSGSVAHTERAPTSYELYANGVHVATAAFERGDPAQGVERARNVDLALEWKRGPNRLKAGLFDTRYSRFIALLRTGEPDFVDDESGEAFPVYAFSGVRARLRGAEVEAAWRVLESPGTLDLEGQLDTVRADNLDAGEPLPRIPPLRAMLALQWQQGRWTARAELRHAARQSRVPADDSATPSWTMLHLATSWRFDLAGHDALLFARLANAGNALGYNASTIATVRAFTPLPGRSVSAGLRVDF